MNEAALLAARRGKDTVELPEVQEAVERVSAGLEKKNRVLGQTEKERVAHHEIGHALAGMSLPGSDEVHKISIIPRGGGGVGVYVANAERRSSFADEIRVENRIAVLLAGRVAAELIYQEGSTGARDDLLKATNIPKNMVKAYGMSEKLGEQSFDQEQQPMFLQNGQPHGPGEYSEETAREIDDEVQRIIDEQHVRVTALVKTKLSILRQAAHVLLEKETITGAELKTIAEQANGASAQEDQEDVVADAVDQ